MRLNNKVAVVTGGTGGLDSCLCRAFAQNGIRAAVCYVESYSKAENIAIVG